MKVSYIFYNSVVGHHHCHIIDDADNQIITEVDLHDAKGQKPYTKEQAINYASQQVAKLDAKRKSIMVTRGIEAMTKAVAEVEPVAEKQQTIIDACASALYAKATAAPVEPKVGVK